MKYLYVDQRVLRDNRKSNANTPPIVILQDGDVEFAHEVLIDGPCKIIHGEKRPLISGVRVWIEAENIKKVR